MNDANLFIRNKLLCRHIQWNVEYQKSPDFEICLPRGVYSEVLRLVRAARNINRSSFTFESVDSIPWQRRHPGSKFYGCSYGKYIIMHRAILVSSIGAACLEIAEV